MSWVKPKEYTKGEINSAGDVLANDESPEKDKIQSMEMKISYYKAVVLILVIAFLIASGSAIYFYIQFIK